MVKSPIEGGRILNARNNKSLTSFAFERIRSDILQCELRPSERLRINALSDHYNVGATAIREALSRLLTEGLVESEDQRGFCVSAVSGEELLDLTKTRITIESQALRLAIAEGDIDWESSILAIFHKLSRLPTPKTIEAYTVWATTHRQFHEALLAGCHSPWTLNVCRLLYDKSERYRNLSRKQNRSSLRDTIQEHRCLMQAVLDRNADKACALLADHFWKTSNIVLSAKDNSNLLTMAGSMVG